MKKTCGYFFLSLLLLAAMLLLTACQEEPLERASGQDEASDASHSASESELATEEQAPTEIVGDGETVLYRTPVIDGALDLAYDGSYSYTLLPLELLNYVGTDRETAENAMKNTSGTAYYLYDDTYLYVCAVIQDETLLSRGAEWRYSTAWPWNDDGAEIYLWFSDADCMAIHTDAFGIRSVVDEHIYGDNHSTARRYHDLAPTEFATALHATEDGYTVELRVPLPDGVGAGSEIGTLLEIDDRFADGEGHENAIGALFPMPRYPGRESFRVLLDAERE